MVLGQQPRPLSTYDISELAMWVDSHDYDAAWLDPATGEVWPAFEGGPPLDENEEEIDLDETDWVPIGGASSRAAYQDMEDFADAVADPLASRQLRDALVGRGAFRRFRDTMWHQPEEVRRAWGAYRELGAELRALEWLVDEGLVAEDETGEARSTREAAARAILESVGGGPRARLILLNGMPGVGKSTLAERCRADHPGVLCCDPDRLRSMIGGDQRESAESVRKLALAMAAAHLRTGHDVVLPQLVADQGQLERFAAAAEEGGGELVMVMLVDDLPDTGAGYARRLEEIAVQSRCAEIRCPRDEVEASYRRLLGLVAGNDG
jgi:predicted ABC-type ATPase